MFTTRRRLLIEPLEPRTLFNSSILGFAYVDANHNDFYDNGEGIAGCTVTVKNNATQFTRQATTRSDGSFIVGFLDPGDYSVTVSGSNLKKPVTLPHTQVVQDQIAAITIQVTRGSGGGGGGGSNNSPPDLSVTVSTPPATLNSKSKPATVTITNKGGAYTGPLTVTAYFSNDQIIDSSDTALPSVSLPLVAIAAKRTKTFPVNLAPFAAILPGGTYYILVRLSDMTGDANAANNAAVSKSTTHVATLNINLVPTAKPGAFNKKTASLPLTLTIKNTGNVAATGPVTVSLAARPATGGADIPLTSPNPVSLTIQPNKSVTVPRSATLLDLTPLPPGTYRIVLTISAVTTPAESPTTDNTILSAPFTIK